RASTPRTGTIQTSRRCRAGTGLSSGFAVTDSRVLRARSAAPVFVLEENERAEPAAEPASGVQHGRAVGAVRGRSPRPSEGSSAPGEVFEPPPVVALESVLHLLTVRALTEAPDPLPAGGVDPAVPSHRDGLRA